MLLSFSPSPAARASRTLGSRHRNSSDSCPRCWLDWRDRHLLRVVAVLVAVARQNMAQRHPMRPRRNVTAAVLAERKEWKLFNESLVNKFAFLWVPIFSIQRKWNEIWTKKIMVNYNRYRLGYFIAVMPLSINFQVLQKNRNQGSIIDWNSSSNSRTFG